MISRLVTWTHIRPWDFWQYCPSKHNLCDETEIFTATISVTISYYIFVCIPKERLCWGATIVLAERQSKHGSWAVVWFKRFELHNYYQLYFLVNWQMFILQLVSEQSHKFDSHLLQEVQLPKEILLGYNNCLCW